MEPSQRAESESIWGFGKEESSSGKRKRISGNTL